MTKKFVALFIVLNFFLACFYLDTWINGSSTSRAIAVVSFSETHTLQVDKYQEKSVDKIYVNGHYYSDKAPLPLFLVIPFYELIQFFGIQSEEMEKTAYIVGDILCGSIPFTLIILIAFLFIRKYSGSEISPVILSMLPFYSSFIFIYSGTFYGHLLSALFLLMAYIFLRFQKRIFLAGLFCGLSFACEFTTAIVFSIWMIQIFMNEKSLNPPLKFFLGLLPSLIFIGFYNYFLTGNILTLSYKYHAVESQRINYGFALPQAEALWGLTFGLKRGIFIYAPFLIIFLYEVLKNSIYMPWKKIISTVTSNYLIIISFVSIIAISSFFEWTGGWCYGPRLIFFIAVLLCFEGALFFSTRNFYKPMFWLLILFGFMCTFMAKSTIVYSVPTEIKNPLTEQVIPNFMNNNFNPNNLLTMLFDIQPQTANYLWLVSFIVISAGLTLLYKKEKTNNAKTIIR